MNTTDFQISRASGDNEATVTKKDRRRPSMRTLVLAGSAALCLCQIMNPGYEHISAMDLGSVKLFFATATLTTVSSLPGLIKLMFFTP